MGFSVLSAGDGLSARGKDVVGMAALLASRQWLGWPQLPVFPTGCDINEQRRLGVAYGAAIG
jgi:hypothetical protein